MKHDSIDPPVIKGTEKYIGYFFYYFIYVTITFLIIIFFILNTKESTLIILYSISRSVKCLAAILGAWFAHRYKNHILLAFFSIFAFVSNPFLPVKMPMGIWFIFDIAFIIALIRSLKIFPVAPNFMPDTVKAPTPEPQKKTSSSSKLFEHITAKDEERPEREHKLWDNILTLAELDNVHTYIIDEANRLQSTDWADYALRLICTHSPALSKLLISGDLNLNLIRRSERKGLEDAVKAIKAVKINAGICLREFFQDLFRAIYEETNYSDGNRFYWYGRDRVVQLLHSYMASRRSFSQVSQKFYDIDGEEFKFDTRIDTAVLKKVRDSLDLLENKSPEVKTDENKKNLKERYRFPIESEHPVIEFDLDRIKEVAIFKYEGSLVNSLYIELKNLLAVSLDCIYLETKVLAHQLFDSEAASFEYERGIVYLVKYTAAVDYFPDRLYVELQELEANSWIANWLRSYKLHIECND